MTTRASIDKDGDRWTLVIERELQHPPERVWTAITDPAHLRAWAPFDADRNLGQVGTATLTTVGTPMAAQSKITRAEEPRLLEYSWGDQDLRWKLDPLGANGTRLTLWHNINRRFIAMGAAGWHMCFDVLEKDLAGAPIGRVVGPPAMQNETWKSYHAKYLAQFAE